MEGFVQPGLSSARMVLEPLTVAHADQIFDAMQEPALYPFVPQEPPADVAPLRERHARLERRTSPDGRQAWFNWVLRHRVDGSCIGVVQATVSPGEGAALVAYTTFIGWQRQGFAKEALGEVLPWLSREFTLDHIDALIDTRNAASIALVRSLGFQESGFVAAADFFKNRSSDEFVYRLRTHPAPEGVA